MGFQPLDEGVATQGRRSVFDVLTDKLIIGSEVLSQARHLGNVARADAQAKSALVTRTPC